MSLVTKAKLFDAEALDGILNEVAEKVAGHHASSGSTLALVGIMRGGVGPADYLADRIGQILGMRPPTAYLDISLYRDDRITTEDDPYSRVTEIPFSIRNKEIVLVDDVLFTGRTIRAGLSSLLQRGRPRLIRLAVVVDRGFRELPIQADYVGRHIEIGVKEGIRVRINEEGFENGIYVVEES